MLLIAGIAMLALPDRLADDRGRTGHSRDQFVWARRALDQLKDGAGWLDANSRSTRGNEACHGADSRALVRAVTDVMWNRDQLQMRAVDALLSGVESKPGRRTRRDREKSGEKRQIMPSGNSTVGGLPIGKAAGRFLRTLPAGAAVCRGAPASAGSMTVTYANDPLLIAAAAAALHDRHVAKRSLGNWSVRR